MTTPLTGVSKSAWTLYAAPITLLVIGAYHVVKDFRWDYHWGFVDPYTFYFYLIAIAIFIINNFSKRWDAEVARWSRRGTFGLLALAASWVHTASSNGWEWVYRQTAADIPANLVGDAADRYWAAYTERLGDIGAFGGIRKLYETYGQSVTFNGQTIFLDAINSAAPEDVRHILEAVDASPWPVPVGYLMILVGVIGQLLAYRLLESRSERTTPVVTQP